MSKDIDEVEQPTRARIKGQFPRVDVIDSFLWFRLVVFNYELYEGNDQLKFRETRTKWVPKWKIYPGDTNHE